MEEHNQKQDMETKQKTPLSDLIRSTIERIREMADANMIVGQPIETPDGVTLIPISKVSFGFGSGGADYGKEGNQFGGGAGAGVNIEPTAFLIIKDGFTRVLPVAVPPSSTVDRVVEMVPGLLDRAEKYFHEKRGKDAD